MPTARLFPVDIFPVPHPIEDHVPADDIVPHPGGPDLQAPLTDAFPFQLFDLRGRGERIRFQALEGVEDLLLVRDGKIFEISTEARRELYNKTSWHSA